VGASPEDLLRLPKNPGEEGWNKVWQRLGAPDKPEGYDFSALKFADGKPLDAAFTDTLRSLAAANHIPKDAATAIADGLVKFLDKGDQAEAAETQAKLASQHAALKESWKTDYDAKLFAAKSAARALQVNKEQLDALEKVIGYDGVMQMFLNISTKIGEDKFVQGGDDKPNLMTKETATARLAALKKDKAWTTRLLAGDVAAQAESHALAVIIAGDDTKESRARSGR
jgi:multidrug efflux pump subunit AcrA (membrane-fusion protein)